VRPDFVVFTSPSLNDLSCLFDAQEPVLVQAFISKLSIETLDVAVISWLAWSDIFNTDPSLGSPGGEILGEKLRPIINPDTLRIPMVQAHLIQEPRHPLPRDR